MGNLKSLFAEHDAVVFFDTETTGTEADACQIIELAAIRIVPDLHGEPIELGRMDTFIRLPDGEKLPEKIVELTGITDELLLSEGVSPEEAADIIENLMRGRSVLMCAHNGQFDACFLRNLLRGRKFQTVIHWLDSLTVYKDRRPYPHKLANAITAYGLDDKVQNSHRAIDDVLALFEVVKAMDEERDDLAEYINIFGFNPKYGVNGRMVRGVTYVGQSFHNSIAPPNMTLPAFVSSWKK